MTPMTTNITSSAISNQITDLYKTTGFTFTSGLIVILTSLLFITIFGLVIKKLLSDSKEDRANNKSTLDAERKQNQELIEKLINIQAENSKTLAQELKNLTELQNKTMQLFNDSVEELYKNVGEHFTDLVSAVNAEKSLTDDEYSLIAKLVFRCGVNNLKNDLDSRIELNSLYNNQSTLICENGELQSMVKKRIVDMRAELADLNYKDEKIKKLLYNELDRIFKDVPTKLCQIFTVENDSYVKTKLFREVKSLCWNLTNSLTEIDVKNL